MLVKKKFVRDALERYAVNVHDFRAAEKLIRDINARDSRLIEIAYSAGIYGLSGILVAETKTGIHFATVDPSAASLIADHALTYVFHEGGAYDGK